MLKLKNFYTYLKNCFFLFFLFSGQLFSNHQQEFTTIIANTLSIFGDILDLKYMSNVDFNKSTCFDDKELYILFFNIEKMVQSIKNDFEGYNLLFEEDENSNLFKKVNSVVLHPATFADMQELIKLNGIGDYMLNAYVNIIKKYTNNLQIATKLLTKNCQQNNINQNNQNLSNTFILSNIDLINTLIGLQNLIIDNNEINEIIVIENNLPTIEQLNFHIIKILSIL